MSKVVFALLSPTPGMHQYTAHLAERAEAELGHETLVVTTRNAPLDRYGSSAVLRMTAATRSTGFGREGLDAQGYHHTLRALVRSGENGVVHFTGVHVWNVLLVRSLRRRGIRVIHTLHDLAPHSDARRRPLIRLWTHLLIDSGTTLLTHGECFRQTLLRRGVAPGRVFCAPLTHGFWGAGAGEAARRLEEQALSLGPRDPLALFFGRIEGYKGVDVLLDAWALLAARKGRRPLPDSARLVVAGSIAPGVALPPLPERVELRNHRVGDDEGLDLFARANLLVLPYRDATQTALVAAAARFGVPSLVTRAGALPEYVADASRGWIVPPGDPRALGDALAEALSDGHRLAAMGGVARVWYRSARREEADTLRRLYLGEGGNERGGDYRGA